MFNTLEEMWRTLSIKDLSIYSNESLDKSSERIKICWNIYNIEVSDLLLMDATNLLKASI